MIAKHYKLRPEGQAHRRTDKARFRRHARRDARVRVPLRAEYRRRAAAQAAARPGTWKIVCSLPRAPGGVRSPNGKAEPARVLRSGHDRGARITKAIRALLARILVSPAFLYRVGTAAGSRPPRCEPLSDWEMASRLSFFLWSSIPDEELRRAAAAGELSNPQQLSGR